jgi:nicotinamidase-related amidase
MKTYGKVAIYENFKEIIDPKHTALVIWDVDNSHVSRAFNKEDFIKNLKNLVAAARANKIPVVYAKIGRIKRSSWDTYIFVKAFGDVDPEKLPPHVRLVPPNTDIHPEVAPQPDDEIIERPTMSIFIGTNFEYLMRNSGISTILFTGLTTEVGIHSCAWDSFNRGFYTVVVRDCVSSSNKEMHETALKLLDRMSICVPHLDIVREWPNH